MKKIVSTAVLFVICICCNAQITRTFWNFTLGESTRQQVVQEMSDKGYKGATGADGTYNIQFAEPVAYGGFKWTHVSFDFADGVLSYVSFQNKFIYSRMNIGEIYESLKTSLGNKYAKYYVNASDGGTKRYVEYNDDMTLIDLDYYPNDKFVTLNFYDVRLNSEVVEF